MCINPRTYRFHSHVPLVVIVFFDYVITFGQEVDLFWRGKLTGATALFLANRYLSLGFYVYVAVLDILPSERYSSQVGQ